MKIFSKQEITDAFTAIPQDIQKSLSTASVGNEIVSIGSEMRLHIDDLGLLNEETAFVMLGLVKPNDFEQRLVERLSLETNKARNIVQMINDRIFSPIRTSIINLHHSSAEDNLETVRPVTMSTQQVTIPKPEMQRENILADIEDTPLTPKPSIQTTFADNKLTMPVTTPVQKIVIGDSKKYSDPYREPAE